MFGLDPVRVDPVVARATAQDLLQSSLQNFIGERRWIYAGDTGVLTTTGPGTVERRSGGVLVRLGSDDVSAGGQNAVSIPRRMAGFRDVCDSAAEVGRGVAGISEPGCTEFRRI